MRPRPVALALALALSPALAGCADPEVPQPPDASVALEVCGNQDDDDGDGLYDCADPDCREDPSCDAPPPKPCDAQQVCGNIVDQLVTPVCVDQKCVPPGPSDARGKPLDVEVVFTLVLKAPFGLGTLPRSSVIRLVYPRRVDGSALSCAELLELNGGELQTRDRLDADRTINQVFRALYPLPSKGAASGDVVHTTTGWFVPKAKGLLLYGEVWSGERQLNHPTGVRLSRACSDNGGPGYDLEVIAPRTKLPLYFEPPG